MEYEFTDKQEYKFYIFVAIVIILVSLIGGFFIVYLCATNIFTFFDFYLFMLALAFVLFFNTFLIYQFFSLVSEYRYNYRHLVIDIDDIHKLQINLTLLSNYACLPLNIKPEDYEILMKYIRSLTKLDINFINYFYKKYLGDIKYDE